MIFSLSMVKLLIVLSQNERGNKMKNSILRQWSNISVMIILRVFFVIASLRLLASLPLYFLVPGLVILFTVLYFIIPKWFNVNDE